MNYMQGPLKLIAELFKEYSAILLRIFIVEYSFHIGWLFTKSNNSNHDHIVAN